MLKDLVVTGAEARALKSAYRNMVRAPSRKPISIDNHTWFYERKSGLLFVHEIHNASGHVETISFEVPWHKLREPAERDK